jgi:GNAT superfamily N-acetyltransferase
MGWQTTGDVAEFLAAAGGFLRAERARNTVFLTVAETMRESPERYAAAGLADPAALPLFGWWTPAAPGTGVTGHAPGGAFLHTPPFPLLLTAVPAEVAASLAATLAGRPLAGVNAYQDAADAFAAEWRKLTNSRVDVHRRSRLYRLGELTWPDPIPAGTPRLADQGDTGLLTDWFTAFAREVDDLDGGADKTAAVREALSHHGLTLWEEGGGPVSLAGLTRQVAGMVRVGPVYTPPELRGHGYASAVTAAVTERARAEGADEVLLYTDLANPVSNSIYQRIGYRPVEDRVVLSFTETVISAR